MHAFLHHEHNSQTTQHIIMCNARPAPAQYSGRLSENLPSSDSRTACDGLQFFMSPAEVKLKTQIWTDANKEYLDKQAAKAKQAEYAVAKHSRCCPTARLQYAMLASVLHWRAHLQRPCYPMIRLVRPQAFVPVSCFLRLLLLRHRYPLCNLVR